jgi:hypothetical protein
MGPVAAEKKPLPGLPEDALKAFPLGGGKARARSQELAISLKMS